MDAQTHDRILKPSAGKFAEMIRTHHSVGSVTDIQHQKGF
jgi:hypothetical protein